MTALRTTFRIFFVLIIFSLMTSCADKPVQTNIKKPEWINGQSSRYPASQYITGQGAYKYLGRAKDLARAEIAKTFQVTVKEDTSDSQSFSQTKTNESSEKKSEQFASRTVTTSTDEMLRGVQIVDVWENTNTSNFHVLAILPRRQTAAILKQEISRIDDATRTYIENAAVARDKLEKIVYARQALDAQFDRIAYQRSMQIVNPSGRGIPQVWRTSKLSTDFYKLVKRIRIKPIVTKDDTNSLSKALSGGIAKAGMTVENSSSADYTIKAALDLDVSNKQKDGWYWARGTLEIELLDKKRNVRGTHRWPVKVSAQDPDTINRRIGDELSRILNKDLQSTIISFSKPS